MIAGSLRGKCWAWHAGQRRTWPASAISVSAPQRAHRGWVACQFASPIACTAIPASRSSRNAPASRRVANSSPGSP